MQVDRISYQKELNNKEKERIRKDAPKLIEQFKGFQEDLEAIRELQRNSQGISTIGVA